MKFNKWTLGLAAVGVVSMGSVAQAEESFVKTALSSTTISGYVDTSAQLNNGGNSSSASGPLTARYAFNQGKANGFNLDVVKVTIEKPLDEAEWAAGYKVDLIYGPNANGYTPAWGNGSTNNNSGIKQAYVALRTPVGNGIDWKMGVWDTIIGYESFDAGNNPNFSRSYGYSIEPTEHTGLLGTYRFSDVVSASVGVANTTDANINGRTYAGTPPNTRDQGFLTYMGSVALTAPESMGWAAGSALYGGIVTGNASGGNNLAGVTTAQTWLYMGGTLATPVAGLKVGAAYDYYNQSAEAGSTFSGDAYSVALYASYQASEKLSLHFRGEYTQDKAGALGYTVAGSQAAAKLWSATATVQYDLWENVISRLEFRWDNGNDQYFGTPSSSAPAPGQAAQANGTLYNAYMFALNVIYKF